MEQISIYMKRNFQRLLLLICNVMNYLLLISSVSEQSNSFSFLKQKLETNSTTLYFNALRQSPFP